jgi:hypothetical protein
MADSATYLYAITHDAGDAPLAGLTGIAGSDVRGLAQAGLRAYVSTVPLDEFGEESLRRNLEDLPWLEATARAHHGVVDAVARTTPTAPVRLVTVYRNDEHVRHMLEERAEEFETVLARVHGRSEWGVKVYVTPERPAQQAPPGDRNDKDEKGRARENPGTAYLKRRQSSLRSRENLQRRVLARAEHIDRTLTALAVASRRHVPQDPQLSGRKEWMVLNNAYLIDEDRADEFTAAAESLRDSDLDLQVTGPWAPYSFATLESITTEPDVAYDG